MKRQDAIILESGRRQILIDHANHFFQLYAGTMNAQAKIDIKAAATEAITQLRNIEAELFDTLSIDYTQGVYDSDVAYISRVAIPQQALEDNMSYFGLEITAIKEALEEEIEQLQFIKDVDGEENGFVDKTGDWTTAEEDAIVALEDLITAIEAANNGIITANIDLSFPDTATSATNAQDIFTVAGSGLDGDITITKVGATADQWKFMDEGAPVDSLTFSPVDGVVDTETINFRFQPTTEGVKDITVRISSPGMADIDKVITGTAIAP
jgi:hypothetical protein